jgi:CHASE3 domain sensor protein
MMKPIQRNLLIGFSFSVICLLASAVASYKSIKNLLNSFEWVNHTTTVDTRVADVMSSLIDAETGMRGYLLNGDDSFLQPYYAVKDSLFTNIDDISFLTSDNPLQRKNCKDLTNIVQLDMSLINDLIQRKKAGEKLNEDSLALGKKYMDESRTITTRMENVENRLLFNRKSIVNRSTVFTLIFIMLASLIAIIVTILFYIRTKQNIDDNQHLHDELIQKEKNTNRQIEVIKQHAEKIAGGDYSARLDPKDLKNE